MSSSPEIKQEHIYAACRESLDCFSQKTFKLVEPAAALEWNWHIGCIAEHLEAVYRGEIRKLIINIPPRTLKTYLVGVAFPAWVMGKTPQSRFINAGYGVTLAEKASVKCRDIVTSEWYSKCFPKHPGLRRDQNHKGDWENTMNGGYYAAGLNGPILGTGCHYFIIDDPLKPNEALSDTVRVSTNENIRNTAFSRFNDSRTGKFIMVMQRLHEDDPSGHLLADGGYVHLNLPAEAKDRPVYYQLGKKHWSMKRGDLLFPQRLTREFLDDQRKNMTEYHYLGQFLQAPVPMGGGEFKETWPQYYRNEINPRDMNIYILVDPAGGEELQKKKKKLSDRTTMMVIGLAPDKNYYWLDGICDRLNPTDRIDRLFDLHRKWAELSGKPPKVGYEHYSIQTDTHYIRQKQEDTTYRFPMVELGGRMEKNERIRRMIPDMQMGRWYFPLTMVRVDYMGRAIDLVRELVKSEMGSFPKSKYDDMMDAMSRVYDADLNVIWPSIKTAQAKDYREKTKRYAEPQGWMDA